MCRGPCRRHAAEIGVNTIAEAAGIQLAGRAAAAGLLSGTRSADLAAAAREMIIRSVAERGRD